MALGLIDLNHFRVLDSRRSRSIFHSQRSLSINLITQPFRARAISSTSVVSHANSFEPTHAQDAYYQSTKFPKISLLPTAMFPLRGALQFTLATFRRQPQFSFRFRFVFASDCRGQCLRERVIIEIFPHTASPI